jgi:hypothetical protein
MNALIDLTCKLIDWVIYKAIPADPPSSEAAGSSLH